MIGFFTNPLYYQRLSVQLVSPADNTLGATALVLPIGGGLIVEAAIASRPLLVSVSFGDWSWADSVVPRGVTTATQVYDADQARQAADADRGPSGPRR